MNKYIIIALLSLTTQAQVNGTWDQYSVFGNDLHFINQVHVMDVNGTILFLDGDNTVVMSKRLDGIWIARMPKHGEYYWFDKDNKLHISDGDGQLDPVYVKLDKIK